jgi:hypothetical protein
MANPRSGYGELLRYVDEGKSLKEMAGLLGMTASGVLRNMHKQGRLSPESLPDGTLLRYAEQYNSANRAAVKARIREAVGGMESAGYTASGVEVGDSSVSFFLGPPDGDDAVGIDVMHEGIENPLRQAAKKGFGRWMKLRCRPAEGYRVEVSMDSDVLELRYKVDVSWFMQALGEYLRTGSVEDQARQTTEAELAASGV